MSTITISGICDRAVYRVIDTCLKVHGVSSHMVKRVEGQYVIALGYEDADTAFQMYLYLRDNTHGEADIKLELTTY